MVRFAKTKTVCILTESFNQSLVSLVVEEFTCLFYSLLCMDILSIEYVRNNFFILQDLHIAHPNLYKKNLRIPEWFAVCKEKACVHVHYARKKGI